MYTAKILQKKELPNGNLEITVEFSNGIKTFTEQVVPQDKVGFERWVKSRVTSLNTTEELQAENNIGVELDYTEPTPDQAELNKRAWFRDFARLERAQKLVELGVLTGSEPKFLALKQRVIDNILPAYIDEV